MRKLFIIVLLASFYFGFSQDDEQVAGAKILFAESSHEFGDITQGDKVEHVFTFENVGTEALVLTDVKTTCGCTAPAWTREPVAPGENGEIKVVFNSRGKVGLQNKVITVMSNAVNSPARVKIVTNVLTSNNQ